MALRNNAQLAIFYGLLLVFLNVLTHFLPFERAAMAPDNYSYLERTNATGVKSPLYYLLTYPHRPLNHLVLDLEGKFSGGNPGSELLLLFFSTLFVVLSVFLLYNEIFHNPGLSFLAAVIFSILPNKLEVYQNSILFNINTVIGLYILSLAAFLRYAKRQNRLSLNVSLCLYTLGIFWYEAGFFLPLIMLAYCLLFRYRAAAVRLFYFAVPALVYAVLRLTLVFGFGTSANFPHTVGLKGVLFASLELLHHCCGRYMARSIIYGLYKFISLEQPWLAVVSILNIAAVMTLAFIIRRLEHPTGKPQEGVAHPVTSRESGRKFPKVDNRLAIFGIIVFAGFLIPNFINDIGGIGGRHLCLPSIGVSLVLLWLWTKMKRYRVAAFIAFSILAMVISEGNAWAQVIACRINAAIYDTIKEKKGELVKADNIIFDVRSFADKIPFTFIARDFNVLNTYYGAQAIESWGLRSMVHLVTADPKKTVYIATEKPTISGRGFWEFGILNDAGYRKVSPQTIRLPEKNTVIINFADVYGQYFNNGLRKKP